MARVETLEIDYEAAFRETPLEVRAERGEVKDEISAGPEVKDEIG
jgi:hypothetical protein